MSTLYELIKKYSDGNDESVMWKSVEVISDAIENGMGEDDKKKLSRKIYCEMVGGHYNEEFALEDVKKMYYTDADGSKKYAPYWTPEQAKEVYSSISNLIPKYNFWDFYVALNMVKSDNCLLLKKWFPNANADEMTKKIVEMTVNWLSDEDNPFGTEKVWKYMNSK